jgi:hypothetical protein
MHRAGSLRNRAVAAFLAVAVGGVVALAVEAAGDERALAFTLGVAPLQVSAVVQPGQTACQAPVLTSSPFSRVRFQVGTYMRSGVPLEVEVRSSGSHRILGHGRLGAGYPDVSQPSVLVGRVPAERSVEVCIRNVGERKVALYGGPAAAAAGSARVDGRETGADLTLIFERAGSRSVLATVPDIFERASLFRPGWVGDWTFWVLALLLGLAVPVLLAVAVARAADRGG